MTAGGGLALAAAVGVVDRVHGGAAGLRPDALVPVPSGLPDRDVLVVGVADRPDRGAAVRRDHAHLPGGKAQGRVAALLRDELDRRSRRAAELAAAARRHLDVVHDGSGRDAGQRQGVADLDVGALARHDLHADRQSLGREDVALLTVAVVQQRDVGGAIRVVLDRCDLGRDAVLAALEVDAPVAALGAAAAVAAGDPAVRVAPAGRRLALDERLLGLRARQLLPLEPGREAPPSRAWWACACGSPSLLGRRRAAPLEQLDAVARARAPRPPSSSRACDRVSSRGAWASTSSSSCARR